MRQLKCHRCGSADLVFYEAYLEHGQFDEGLFVNDEGHIQARGAGYFRQGEPQSHLNEIECRGCGHRWHPRRHFAGNEESVR